MGKGTCVIKHRSYADGQHHHDPVCARDVDLSMEARGSVDDLDVGEVGHVDGLGDELEGTGDHCLGGYDGREDGEYE